MNIPHTPKGQVNNMLIFQLCGCLIRGTQRQFSENICSEDDLKGLCQLESMRSEVMKITFNCQNSIVFNA